jgi:hypothetical protein
MIIQDNQENNFRDMSGDDGAEEVAGTLSVLPVNIL